MRDMLEVPARYVSIPSTQRQRTELQAAKMEVSKPNRLRPPFHMDAIPQTQISRPPLPASGEATKIECRLSWAVVEFSEELLKT